MTDDGYILYDKSEWPEDAAVPESAIIVSLHDARGAISEAYLPYEVTITRIQQMWVDRYILAANRLREELRLWCMEQWGPGAIGGVLNPAEARHPSASSPRGLVGSIARVPFDTAALWSLQEGAVYRFKDERHAALFKLRAY